eukprot:SAG22_NODE_11498_length_481_cov_1.439791_1_plen_65_part_00
MDKEKKEASRKPRGRPKKVQEVAEVEETPPPPPPAPKKVRAQGGRKQTQVYIDDEYSSKIFFTC